jgi:ABC-type glutathione transport system ATPase component
MILEVDGLTVQFPTRRGILTAVDSISFSIAPGEVLGVVGESGAGKSITGLAVIRLLEPPTHRRGRGAAEGRASTSCCTRRCAASAAARSASSSRTR